MPYNVHSNMFVTHESIILYYPTRPDHRFNFSVMNSSRHEGFIVSPVFPVS